MNTFYNKISFYNKLNYNIQNIVLNKLFKKHKKKTKIIINKSIKSIHRIKCRFFKPSIVKKYKNNILKLIFIFLLYIYFKKIILKIKDFEKLRF